MPGQIISPLGPFVNQTRISAPVSPSAVIASAQNASASVQWYMQPSAGITAFVITASPGGAQVQVGAVQGNGLPTTQALLTGLTNGTAYTFTVQAVNSFGASPANLIASNSVTPTALPASVLPVTSGLEFWWSAKQVVSPPSNGTVLTTMTDFSGNGYNAAGQGPTGGTWVASWSNSKPSVAFSGTSSNQRYDTTASGLSQGMRGAAATIFAVYSVAANPNAASATEGRILSAEGNAVLNLGCGFGLGSGSTSSLGAADIFNNSFGFSGATFSSSTFALNTPVYVSITRPGALRLNGSAVTGVIDPAISYALSGVGANLPWTFGAQAGGAYNKSLQGNIAEIIMYSRVLSPSEISSTETYLQTLF